MFAFDETRSQLVEAVAVRAARIEERAMEEQRDKPTEQRMRPRPSIGRAFARFLDLFATFRSLEIATLDNDYDNLHVPVRS